jgi:hypothetical protein
MDDATMTAAYHEAGHVVAALLAGGPAPTFVTIRAGAAGAGYTRFKQARTTGRPTRRQIDAWAATCAAGVTAEEIVSPAAAAKSRGEGNDVRDEDAVLAAFEALHGVEARVEAAMAHSSAGSYDAVRERVLAAWGYGRRFEAWREGIDRRARRLLATPRARRAVAAVAAALLQRGTLQGAEAIRRVALGSDGR